MNALGRGAAFAKSSVAVSAGLLALILGLAASALMPGPQTPVGLFGSAFTGSASTDSGVETVEGEVSGYAYSPSGRHVHGFHLDGGGFFGGGRTSIHVPPGMAASSVPREGSSVKVSGVSRTGRFGEDELHAMSITDIATGRTFGTSNPVEMSAPPPGDPGFLPDPRGKGAEGDAKGVAFPFGWAGPPEIPSSRRSSRSGA